MIPCKIEQPTLEVIIEKLSGNVWWKGKNLRYLGCNGRVLRILDLKREDFIGKTDYELWGEGIADKLLEADLRVLTTGETITLEEVITQKDGTYIVMLTNKSPYYDKDNNIAGIVGTSTDITARKRAEDREKIALEKEAEAKGKAEAEEQLRQSVSIISGSIAHDLRTPLCIIEMEAERVKKYIPFLVYAYYKAEEAKLIEGNIQKNMLEHFLEIGESILEEIHGMNDFITSSLKTLSKAISKDTSSDDLLLCSIDKCIDQTIRRYPFTEEERKLIHWNRKTDFKFMGNEILMIGSLFNLIKNSLEQIRKNHKGEIFITTEISDNENFLYIKDTAGGAPPEVLKHLFDGYKTTKQGGTGVGLASCKKLMQSFGGNITCHSEYGNYIKFTFSFPKNF